MPRDAEPAQAVAEVRTGLIRALELERGLRSRFSRSCPSSSSCTLRNVETLRPLAHHPSLEFLYFGRVRDLDLDPLATIPNLRQILTGAYRWNRDVHSFPYRPEVLAIIGALAGLVVELRARDGRARGAAQARS